ncbi:protein APCDD1-like [Linepithema humile]|uniref:protein APCDD1-like n=1 Tax=Linepithema humile TaxID=83485 RepID=UPI000622FE0E|nr:PREDICTED: protein APCDD1-like [Linepithema humile]
MLLIAVIKILLILETCCVTIANTLNILEQCAWAIKQIEEEDHETVVENSSAALHTTWVSQGCEVQAGPRFVIRKYTFFQNNTFLLMRFYYADDSCCVASHTVEIRGIIHLQELSDIVSGATETKFHVNTVHITPLNEEITYTLETKFNQSCGPRPKWTIYNAELIYEQSYKRSSVWQNPIHNSLQVPSFSDLQLDMYCLKSFGIDFDELKLLRVERRPTLIGYKYWRLLLANPVSHVYSRCCYKPTSLQPTAMVRADMKKDCPLCKILSRSTATIPPVLHQAVPLPAIIGGYWLSEGCESTTGGSWSKRRFEIYAGDRLWTGQWDYYSDSQCKNFLYTTTASGSYTLRGAKLGYFRKVIKREIFLNNGSWKDVTKRTTGRKRQKDRKVKRQKRSTTEGVDQYLQNIKSSTKDEWRIAAMLRNRRTSLSETTTERPYRIIPSGISELDLHVVESSLIPEDAAMFIHCVFDKPFGLAPDVWEKYCAPRIIEVSSIIRLRAKLSVNWNGQYVLLLADQDEHPWQAPLRLCASTSPHNRELQMHLHKSVTHRFGLLSSTATTISQFFSVWFYLLQFFLFYVYYLAR